ncbi:MAG: hypothetical protein A3G87_08845 [Omnitrophica bacterium RIFCSPLOWO2_12_FULL_50_11]|nr:MAG: hypothetical protein A3G87_08845 [Omnitrophica bacterium RIFCSPLOWO2_12_FULL_50_11]
MGFSFRKLWEFLRSFRLANFLLAVVAAIAAFGTFPASFKFLLFVPRDVFHHKGFLILLGCLAALAGYYVIWKASQLLSKSKPGFSLTQTPVEVPSQTFQIPFNAISGYESSVLRAISRCGYQLRSEKSDRRFSLFAWKNKWGIWGAPILHAGLVLVLFGGLLTSLFAEVRDVELPEGETVVLPEIRGKIRLEKFSVILHPGRSQPDEYVSNLLVERDGKKVRRYELKVNQPLRIGLAKLFQMRYRVEIPRVDLVAYQNGKAVERLPLKLGESKALTRFPFLVQVDDVVPDFTMNQEGKVASRSPYFQNPAVQVTMHPIGSPNDVYLKTWAFPDLVRHQGSETEEWSFAIDKIRKRYVSGIKLSMDPGVAPAYFGFILLVFGAFVSSFVVPRRFVLHFEVSPDGRGTRMALLGGKAKDTFGLEQELCHLREQLSKLLV